MPEIKHTFTGGKMNKDLAIQFVPNGEYRDAMNIQVRTTGGETDGIGSAGNVQNVKSSKNFDNIYPFGRQAPVQAAPVASIADDKTNSFYIFYSGIFPKNFSEFTHLTTPDQNLDYLNFTSEKAGRGLFFRDVIWREDLNNSSNSKPVVVDYFGALQAWIQVVGGAQYGDYEILDDSGNVTDTILGSTLPQEDFNQLTVLDARYYRVGMICEAYSSSHVLGKGVHNGLYFKAKIKSVDTTNNTITFYDNINVSELPVEGSIDGQPILGVAGFRFIHPDRPLNFPKPNNTLISYDTANSINDAFFDHQHLSLNNSDTYQNITGINIIDNLLFWTDGYGEPKKINIDRCLAGTNLVSSIDVDGRFEPIQHTQLVVQNPASGDFTPVLATNTNSNLEASIAPENNDLKEEHVTVIRPAPRTAPTLEMSRTNRVGEITTSIIDFSFTTQYVSSGVNVTAIVQIGDIISVVPEAESDGSFNVYPFTFQDTNFFVNDIITFTSIAEDVEDEVAIKAKFLTYVNYNNDELVDNNSPSLGIKVQILSVDPNLTNSSIDWNAELELSKPLFEHKFVRFGYRYRYEDGEYSSFSPWSELAFLPDEFEYSPRKGFNLGMSNQLRYLCIKDFIPLNTDRNLDVSGVDILFKTTESPVCYIVKTIEREIDPEWEYFTPGTQNAELNTGKLVITSEMIHRILPEDQLLRSWDNVPRFAKAQEIVANRLVYGNYTQGYNLDFRVGLEPSVVSLNTPTLTDPKKSIKSLRNYKLGLVLGDKYGRETPVIESSSLTGSSSSNWNVTTSDIITEKQLSITQNKLNISQDWSFTSGFRPTWVDYVKYYIKETSNEYYNLVMDRWYDAEDGNIWLSFNSADRNKIDEETYLILKNAAGSQTPILEKARYKVIAIANEAPDFIKTERVSIGTIQLDPTGEGSNLFIGSVNTETLPPTNLMQATFLDIPSSTENVEILQGISRGRLRLRFIGRTFNSDGTVANELFTRFVPVSNHAYTDADSNITTPASNLRVHWQRSFNESVNMFQRFSDAGYTLNTSSDDNDLKYFVEISEDTLENKPEFDGKFFVKIETDVTIEEHVMLSSPASISFNPIFAFGISYISTQDQNPGLNGPFSESEGTAQQSTWAGGNDENNSALSNNWPLGYFNTSLSPNQSISGPQGNLYPLNSGGVVENLAANIERFAIGCKDCDGVQDGDFYPGDCQYSTANGRRTREYWKDYIDNAPGDSIFIDNSRSAYFMQGAGTAGEWYDNGNNDYGNRTNFLPDSISGQGWSHSSKYFRPLGFDTSPELLASSNTNVSSTFNRITFSVINHTWTGNAEGNNQEIFRALMGIDGTLFRFAKDNSNGGEPFVYRIKGTAIQTKSGTSSATRNHMDNQNVNETSVFSVIYGPQNIAFHGIYPEDPDGWGAPDNLFLMDEDNYNINLDDASATRSQGNGPFDDSPNYIDYIPTWDGSNIFPTSKEGCDVCTGGNSDYHCFRSSIRIEFEKINPDTGIPYEDGRGINPEEWDPRGHVRHDGTTSFLFEIVKKTVTTTGELPSPIEGACWETEPKEDVDLDIYYEASDAIPFILNEGNTTAFAPINSKVSIKRIIGGVETDYTPSSASGGVYTETFEPYVSNIYYSENSPLIEVKSFSEELDDYSSATANLLSGSFGIGDMMVFNHNNGTITKSFITNFYDATSLVETNRFTAVISKNNTYNDINNPLIIPNLINFTGNNSATAVNGAQVISVFPAAVVTTTFLQNFGNIDGTTTPNIQLTDTSWMQDETEYTVTFAESSGVYEIDPIVYNYPIQLGWFNCYAFGNGVESDRVRDDFNAPQIDNGVKVSSTFSGYAEENKSSGLIYSGIYNSISEINNLNEFNQSQKITKDLNPSYGSIQALKTRDTDVVTFCEDKVLKVLANKDALFNADGNPQLTATDRVLGTAIPFGGYYGISKNPESLAVDSFRMYFTDKERGAVLRLSRDGLTPISNVGMKTWFRENIKDAVKLLGTFDTINGEYNLTISKQYRGYEWTHSGQTETVSFNEGSKGWVSFKSFIPETGLSINDRYVLSKYQIGSVKHVDMFKGEDYLTFLQVASTQKYSSIDVLFNDIPGSVKSFHTINYEGSQAKVVEHQTFLNQTDAAGNSIEEINTSDGEFYNLENKKGWFVESFETDLQSGSVPEFIDKENKWFNYIKGAKTTLSNLDTSEFTVQGLGTPYVTGPVPRYISIEPVSAVVSEGEMIAWIITSEYIPAGTTLEVNMLGPNSTATIDDIEVARRVYVNGELNLDHAWDWNTGVMVNTDPTDPDFGQELQGAPDEFATYGTGTTFTEAHLTNVKVNILSDTNFGEPDQVTTLYGNISGSYTSSFLNLFNVNDIPVSANPDLIINSDINYGAAQVLVFLRAKKDFTTEGSETIECVVSATDSNGIVTNLGSSIITIVDSSTTTPSYTLTVQND